VFNVIRRRGDGMFDEAARRRVRLIAPHIRRAVLIGKAIDLKSAETASLTDAFDGLVAGMFLTEGNGRIVHANAAGHAILAEADFLRATSGRLVAANPDSNHALKDVLAAAENGDAAIGTRGISLPFATRTGENYVAHVLPLKSGARRRAGSAHSAAAAIFVHKAALEIPSAPEAIARHYRLTPTELRVLLAIVEVGGVPEVAEALGVADTTVKTHLGNLYGKTGTGRQADLVKLVAGFASPLVN
jgi:DNA-binding CsgD family transcriptional regulator